MARLILQVRFPRPWGLAVTNVFGMNVPLRWHERSCLSEMESCRFAPAAVYAIILIFVFFGVATAADISPTPSPQTGAGSGYFVPSFAFGFVGFVVALFACFLY